MCLLHCFALLRMLEGSAEVCFAVVVVWQHNTFMCTRCIHTLRMHMFAHPCERVPFHMPGWYQCCTSYVKQYMCSLHSTPHTSLVPSPVHGGDWARVTALLNLCFATGTQKHGCRKANVQHHQMQSTALQGPKRCCALRHHVMLRKQPWQSCIGPATARPTGPLICIQMSAPPLTTSFKTRR